MFKIVKLSSSPARSGLDWAVVRVDYAGKSESFAYCPCERNARKLADAMNDLATVAIILAE